MGFLLCNYQHYVFDKVRFRTRIGSTPSRNAVNLPNTPHSSPQPLHGAKRLNKLVANRQTDRERERGREREKNAGKNRNYKSFLTFQLTVANERVNFPAPARGDANS